MDKQTVTEKVKAHAKDGKIACKQAFKIAEETGTPTKELGDPLNELDIKVASCQLGCFP
jgi:hypothetical protein